MTFADEIYFLALFDSRIQNCRYNKCVRQNGEKARRNSPIGVSHGHCRLPHCTGKPQSLRICLDGFRNASCGVEWANWNLWRCACPVVSSSGKCKHKQSSAMVSNRDLMSPERYHNSVESVARTRECQAGKEANLPKGRSSTRAGWVVVCREGEPCMQNLSI